MDTHLAHSSQGVQAVLIGAGADDFGIIVFGGVEIMVVIIQARLFQPVRLLVGEHPQRHASFHSQRTDPFDHRHDALDIAISRTAPCRPHAETGSTLGFGLAGSLQHIIDRDQFLTGKASLIMRALRAIRAILGASAGFDAEQATDLHLIRVKMFAVDGLGLID